MSRRVVLGTGRCRSVGGRAGLGQPGRGARATQQPVWCGGHVDGGRVGGRLFESSPVPAALINVAFLASFLFFLLLFLVFFKFSFSRCFPPFVFLSYHWCRCETNVHEVFFVLHYICHYPPPPTPLLFFVFVFVFVVDLCSFMCVS